jgi:hypothetical protein
MSQDKLDRMAAPQRFSNRSRVWLASAALAAVSSVGPTYAAPETGLGAGAISLPDTGLGPTALLVPDVELAEMRGRLLESEAMKFFGIRLLSSWQGEGGLTMTAMIQLDVDFTAAQPNISLKAGFAHDCNTCTDEAMEIPGGSITGSFDPGGLGSVSGAVQSTVISGDDNAVRNNMRVSISTADVPALSNNNVADIHESRTETFSDGSAIEFQVGDNSVGLALQGPGTSGVASQAVNSEGSGQIAQHVKLNGNYNTIANTLDVMIGIEQLQQTANTAAIQNALSAMKGMGF